MSLYKEQLIFKAEELEKIARELQEGLESRYMNNKPIQAQDVARATGLKEKSRLMRQAAERAEG